MEKPIVFLSHSSLDKAPLAMLKQILHERAVGSIDFFLSSDGQSIKFGKNWIVSVSDALEKTKLMFVFLSPQSVDSKWVHFEAGYACANVRVVPVCLPGIDFNRVTPPLSHLQGFNLHSNEAMGNLARICNEVLGLEISEKFTAQDFNVFVEKISGRGASFFGEYAWAIDEVTVSIHNDVPSADYNPIQILDQICKNAGMKCRSKVGLTNDLMPHDNGLLFANFEQAGCEIKFKHIEDENQRRDRIQRKVQQRIQNEKPIPKTYSLECKLSPEMFHVNAPLLDQWFSKANLSQKIRVRICFNKNIDGEKKRERLTGKLYQWGIGLLESGEFEFDGFEFGFNKFEAWKIFFDLTGKLEEKRLSETIKRMFESSVLWEHEPSISELFP